MPFLFRKLTYSKDFGKQIERINQARRDVKAAIKFVKFCRPLAPYLLCIDHTFTLNQGADAERAFYILGNPPRMELLDSLRVLNKSAEFAEIPMVRIRVLV
jgi:hypothetical protein